MNKSSLLLGAAMLLSTIVAAGASQAALVNCPTDFIASPTAKVEDGAGTQTAVSACQNLTPADSSNVASVANINAAGFFGVKTWADNGQTQIDPPVDSGGAWSITGVDFANFNYAIVFKDGSGTNLTAFLFNELFSSGVWSTPFTDPPFDLPGGSTVHDVSHYTIVKTASNSTLNSTRVPEPGSLALLGAGLLGLGMARRRRSA